MGLFGRQRASSYAVNRNPSSRGFDETFKEIFGEILKSGERGDLRYNLELSLEEAARGIEAKIRIAARERCTTCNGSGAKPGTLTSICPKCQSSGQTRVSEGFFSIQQTCQRCHGTGKIVHEACPTCEGAGRIKKEATLLVKIPAGINQDDRVRLSGEGEAGINGGPPGDLYVVATLKPHPVFRRENNDLHCEIPISVTTASQGGEIEIPTLDGHAKFKIPPETQAGQVFRIREKGIKGVGSSVHGDLYCHVAIEARNRGRNGLAFIWNWLHLGRRDAVRF
jgi:molecular chaperone DnaJ